MTKTGKASDALARNADTAAVAEYIPPGEGQPGPQTGDEDFSETTRSLKDGARDIKPKQRVGGRIKSGPRAGQDFYFDYFTADQVMDLLDEETPQWSFRVKIAVVEYSTDRGTQVCIYGTGSLTINGVTREGVGTGLVRPDCPLETAIKKADSDSLKRAALKFGVGLARIKAEAGVAYAAEGKAVERPGQRAERPNPRAQNQADLLTDAQKQQIVQLCEKLGVGRNYIEQEVGCKAEEMSKRAASSLINVMQQQMTSKQAENGAAAG